MISEAAHARIQDIDQAARVAGDGTRVDLVLPAVALETLEHIRTEINSQAHCGPVLMYLATLLMGAQHGIRTNLDQVKAGIGHTEALVIAEHMRRQGFLELELPRSLHGDFSARITRSGRQEMDRLEQLNRQEKN